MRFVVAASIVAGSLFAMNAAGIAQMTQAGASESQGRRICRYVDETGKLAARRRVCMTRAEWERTAEEQRKNGQMMVNAADSCARRADGGGSIGISAGQSSSATNFSNC